MFVCHPACLDVPDVVSKGEDTLKSPLWDECVRLPLFIQSLDLLGTLQIGSLLSCSFSKQGTPFLTYGYKTATTGEEMHDVADAAGGLVTASKDSLFPSSHTPPVVAAGITRFLSRCDSRNKP